MRIWQNICDNQGLMLVVTFTQVVILDESLKHSNLFIFLHFTSFLII